ARTACLVLDVRMPNMDGLEVQRRLAERGVRIPIVFLTGRASDDEERRARSAGAVEFLRKPVGTATLLHVLQKLFQVSHLFAEKAMPTESRPSDESKARGAIAMMRETSAIAEPTAWTEDPRTTPSRRADVRRTVEPGDDPSNPAAVHGIIGGSLALRRVIRLVESVATTDATVLIRGETGTGKELIGGLIHTLRARRGRPLVKFNCTAIPAGLLESEL